MANRIVITDQKVTDYDEFSKIYVFSHLKINHGKKVIYLSQILDENSDIYKKKYLDFFSNIYKNLKKKIYDFQVNKTFNNFTSSLFFEKSPFKTNLFDQLQLLVLFDLLKKEKNYEVIYDLKNPELKLAINNLINYLQNKKKSQITISSNLNIKLYLSTVYAFFKVFILSLRINLINKKNYLVKNIYFSYYKKNYSVKTDPYWKNVFEKINKNTFSLFLLDYEDFKEKKERINQVFYASDFFKLKNFIVLISIYLLKNNFNKQLNLVQQSFNKSEYSFLFPIIYKDLKKSFSGPIFIENYYNNISISNFLNNCKDYKKVKKIFYLCEFHPHENYINYFKRSFKTYGFVHSTLRYWLLNYFFSKNVIHESKNIFNLPSFLLANGPKAFNEFKKFIQNSKLKKVEAIRHFNIMNFKKNINLNGLKKNNLRIFYGDIQNKSTEQIIEILIKNNKTKSFCYKPHPDSTLKVKRFLHTKKFKIYKNHDLNNILNNFNVFIFGSTSSSMEFYLLKKKIVIFKDETNLNLSPLFKYVTKKFSYEGKEYLIKNNKYQVRSFFYLNSELKFWKKLI